MYFGEYIEAVYLKGVRALSNFFPVIEIKIGGMIFCYPRLER